MMIPLTGYNSFSPLYGTIDDFVPHEKNYLRKIIENKNIDDDIAVDDAYYRKVLENELLSGE